MDMLKTEYLHKKCVSLEKLVLLKEPNTFGKNKRNKKWVPTECLLILKWFDNSFQTFNWEKFETKYLKMWPFTWFVLKTD